MSAKIPEKVRTNIRNVVYDLADEFGYMQKGRTENAVLMEQLIDNPAVGGVLKEFIPKERIKTYIKDAVLNRYAKERNRDSIPHERDEIIKNVFGVETIEVEGAQTKAGVSFHRCTTQENCYFVVTVGTYVKWETALRKALEYMSKLPCLSDGKACCGIVLILMTSGRALPQSDKNHLAMSLRFAGAKAYFP